MSNITVNYLVFNTKASWETCKNLFISPNGEGFIFPQGVEIASEDFGVFDGKVTTKYFITVICNNADLPSEFEPYKIIPQTPKNVVLGVNS